MEQGSGERKFTIQIHSWSQVIVLAALGCAIALFMAIPGCKSAIPEQAKVAPELADDVGWIDESDRPSSELGKREVVRYGSKIEVDEEYRPDGSLARQLVHLGGRSFGTSFEWHVNGRLAASGSWLGEQRAGLWYFWDEGGRLVETAMYHEGQKLEIAEDD